MALSAQAHDKIGEKDGLNRLWLGKFLPTQWKPPRRPLALMM
jgi:hypothetical protein